MVNVVDLLRAQVRGREGGGAAPIRSGVILGPEQGRWRVAVGSSTVLADLGASVSLSRGDHVVLAMGGGAPKIVGLLGLDEGLA